ncbi:EAL domain-containing protein [Paenibacillus sp. N3/727]|uniref:putative bifunctional diguanylate cyclase/phosphodiesterase n=1 Tax=Paenibacillus sp. N3/727 TaxID=2925845 RepID=UPI001F52C083|nr:EAL domain-containing protein [Paenibacillus sp. N3/727]UNK17452.1 EAL domain-containing protein [Paenibacillus sp. N3/727]
MLNNVEERKTVRTGIAVVVAVLLLLFFQNPVYRFHDWSEYAPLYLAAGVANVAICFSIFTQGWIYFSNQLSRQRLYTGMLFLFVLIFDLIHTLGAIGFPLFHWTLSMNESLWLLLLSKYAVALGILFTFSFRDRAVGTLYKRIILMISILGSCAAVALFFMWQSRPVLINEQGMTMVKKAADTGILALLLLAVGMIIYKGHAEKPPSLLIIVRGLIFFILGQILFVKSSYITDVDHLLGLACGCIGSFLILRGGYRLSIQDPLDEQRKAEAQISYLAYHDDLTGLPNLRKLLLRLETFIEKGHGIEGLTVAVLNIKRFKTINDSLGRDAGDCILQMASRRIVHEAKIWEEVYSMGGDEFAIILTDGGTSEQMIDRIESFLNLFNKPLQYELGDYHLSLSAGFAIYPEDGTAADQLVQNADTAVHDTKGEHRIRRYAPFMQLKAQERLIMETELRRGLERGEFFLEYQPLVWLQTNQVVGMEALVRWNHPVRGIVYPGEFITIAEDSGLIVPLGEWVLRQACQQNKQWQMAGYRPLCVSINLSLGQFIQPNLPERIAAILKEIQLEPQYVELEITESMTLDKEAALDQLHRLKKLGIKISIDDFGTGYSSLHYLKNLPIDRLKIDRSFVNEILRDNKNAAIVSTIATMAHHLKLKVTAEGVETEDQLSFLRNQQCHEGQGYYFSRPIGARDFERSFLIQ